MELTPKASVIILTYNQEDTIRRALDSVLKQRCEVSYEIVIGDDASTDRTREICLEYAEKYPDIVRMMPPASNKGLVDNYFDCLLNCRGEYIADCAGDDMWGDPDRLQLQVDYLDSHPEYIAVMSDWVIRKRDSDYPTSQLPEYKIFQHNIKGHEMMRLTLGVTEYFPLLSAMLFRRQPITEILKYRPDILRCKSWRCEDLPLIVTLASIGDFGYLPINASIYIEDDRSVTNTRSKKKLFDFYLGSTQCVLDLAKLHNVALAAIKPAIQARFNYLASLMISIGDRERRRSLKNEAKRAKSQLLFKTRLYLALTSNPLTWHLLQLHFRYEQCQ